jgi:hypothetical protein
MSKFELLRRQMLKALKAVAEVNEAVQRKVKDAVGQTHVLHLLLRIVFPAFSTPLKMNKCDWGPHRTQHGLRHQLLTGGGIYRQFETAIHPEVPNVPHQAACRKDKRWRDLNLDVQASGTEFEVITRHFYCLVKDVTSLQGADKRRDYFCRPVLPGICISRVLF